MNDIPYSNRELDEKFRGVHDKLDSNKTDIMYKLGKIEDQTTYTNGKVKKIVVALIALAAFSAGLGLQQLLPLIKLFT